MGHVRLAPSAAHRWMECPGSLHAEAGYPDSSSSYAREGTAAHELAEACLTSERSPFDFVGDTFEVEGYDIEVTEEMASAVHEYIGVVLPIEKAATVFGVERKVDLAPLGPPEEMSGTADFWAYLQKEKELVVADLKYGMGVKVDAEDNPQARYYALGVWVGLMTGGTAFDMGSVDTIRILVVQPRLRDEDGEPRVSEEVISLTDLRKWAKLKLLPAARLAVSEGAERVAGGHCKFCKAKADCPTFRGVALATAETDFADLLEPETPVGPPDPARLTPEELGVILEKIPVLEEWASAIRGRVETMLESGESVPGWARKPKRATRRWKDEGETLRWLTEDLEADEQEIFDRKLKSPAQIEKLVGKTAVPDDLIVAQSSGFNLCRDSDPKALPSGITDFDALP